MNLWYLKAQFFFKQSVIKVFLTVVYESNLLIKEEQFQGYSTRPLKVIFSGTKNCFIAESILNFAVKSDGHNFGYKSWNNA